MDKQQWRFYNIINITPKRIFEQYNIPPISKFIEQQCLNVIERIINNDEHPVTIKIKKEKRINTRSIGFAPSTARTNKYQQSCLQKCIRIKRDSYANKYTNPRKPETTTAEYAVEAQQNKHLKQQPRNNNTTNIYHIDTGTNFICPTCNKRLSTQTGLKRHITIKHRKW